MFEYFRKNFGRQAHDDQTRVMLPVIIFDLLAKRIVNIPHPPENSGKFIFVARTNAMNKGAMRWVNRVGPVFAYIKVGRSSEGSDANGTWHTSKID